MDIISAYREVGTYRGAAVLSGTTHKTVKRVIARHEAAAARRSARRGSRNYRRRGGSGGRAGEGDGGADLGEAAAAGRPGRRVCGVGAELPAAGRGVQAGVARVSITVAAGRRCGRRVSIW